MGLLFYFIILFIYLFFYSGNILSLLQVEELFTDRKAHFQNASRIDLLSF